MLKYTAFLRAINVGGHTVKMDALRELFEGLGFGKVETFIASGNVIFEVEETDSGVIEKRIEDRLSQALGYEVTTFIRSGEELRAVASYEPFAAEDLARAAALNVAFLKAGLNGENLQKLTGLRTEIDDFHVQGRELYWLCRKKQSESTFSNAVLEKRLGIRATLRGIDTVRKIAVKFFDGASPTKAMIK